MGPEPFEAARAPPRAPWLTGHRDTPDPAWAAAARRGARAAGGDEVPAVRTPWRPGPVA
ncbi:hypothetical protein ACF07W_11700 [Streptomyces sp. NPDC015140]|uniref:hypothetical protein n=1 Tax=Streptomyces sp. NPDC015140 TaxID=3364943 RepID=UPI0036F871C1